MMYGNTGPMKPQMPPRLPPRPGPMPPQRMPMPPRMPPRNPGPMPPGRGHPPIPGGYVPATPVNQPGLGRELGPGGYSGSDLRTTLPPPRTPSIPGGNIGRPPGNAGPYGGAIPQRMAQSSDMSAGSMPSPQEVQRKALGR